LLKEACGAFVVAGLVAGAEVVVLGLLALHGRKKLLRPSWCRRVDCGWVEEVQLPLGAWCCCNWKLKLL